jgi:hypothetical protein
MADIKITITIPDGKAATIIDGFARQHRYQDTINGAPNPQSKKDFSLEVIKGFVRDTYKAYKAKSEGEAARDAAKTDADNFTNDITVL